MEIQKEEVERKRMRNETLMVMWSIWKLKDRRSIKGVENSSSSKGVENSFVKFVELLCFMHTFRKHMEVL